MTFVRSFWFIQACRMYTQDAVFASVDVPSKPSCVVPTSAGMPPGSLPRDLVASSDVGCCPPAAEIDRFAPLVAPAPLDPPPPPRLRTQVRGVPHLNAFSELLMNPDEREISVLAVEGGPAIET